MADYNGERAAQRANKTQRMYGMSDTAKGHLSAFITVFLWGLTFFSSKSLLQFFSPLELLFFRFLVGFAGLFLISPKPFKWQGFRREGLFCLAGLFGVCVYFLLQNMALTHTQSANVGVIVSVAPFFTALLHATLYQTRLSKPFFMGFLLSMTGIILISFIGQSVAISPLGDGLAVLAASGWAFYSILCDKLAKYRYPLAQSTRRIFLYGLILMLPVLPLFHFRPQALFSLPATGYFHLLFLGLIASALCFMTWNYALNRLGPVRVSIYIYLSPVFAVLVGVTLLHETLTPQAIAGIALILLGLMLSERKPKSQAPARND